jgi:hypothetical protein
MSWRRFNMMEVEEIKKKRICRIQRLCPLAKIYTIFKVVVIEKYHKTKCF